MRTVKGNYKPFGEKKKLEKSAGFTPGERKNEAEKRRASWHKCRHGIGSYQQCQAAPQNETQGQT